MNFGAEPGDPQGVPAVQDGAHSSRARLRPRPGAVVRLVLVLEWLAPGVNERFGCSLALLGRWANLLRRRSSRESISCSKGRRCFHAQNVYNPSVQYPTVYLVFLINNTNIGSVRGLICKNVITH
jgi:hypothetical protein